MSLFLFAIFQRIDHSLNQPDLAVFSVLLAARIVTGIFGGVIGSVGFAIITDLFKFEVRGRVMGFLQMGFGASQVLGIPISLYLSNHWGWQSPFLMIVGMATIILVLLVAKMQPIIGHLGSKTESNAFKHLWNTIKNKNYRIGFLTTALLSIGGYMMMPWGSAFAINNLKVTNEQLPYLFMVAGVATLLIMPVIGKLSDKIDKFKIFSFASIWLIIVAVFYTNLSESPLWFVMIFNIAIKELTPAFAYFTQHR